MVSRMEWIFSQASFCSCPQMTLYPFFRRLEIGFVTSARSGKKWLSCCRAPNSDHTSFTDVGGDKCFRAVILPWFGETPPSLTTYPQYPTLRSIAIFAWINLMFLFSNLQFCHTSCLGASALYTHLNTWLLKAVPGHPVLKICHFLQSVKNLSISLDLNFPAIFFSSASRMNEVRSDSSGLRRT